MCFPSEFKQRECNRGSFLNIVFCVFAQVFAVVRKEKKRKEKKRKEKKRKELRTLFIPIGLIVKQFQYKEGRVQIQRVQKEKLNVSKVQIQSVHNKKNAQKYRQVNNQDRDERRKGCENYSKFPTGTEILPVYWRNDAVTQ